MPLSSAEAPMHYGSQVPSSESMVQTGSSLVDRELVAALRSGNETVFSLLVREHGPGMLRVARNYVSSQAVAEEVVQEA